MEHKEKTLAIQFIRPNSIFTLRGNDLDWLDETQTKPTEAEIEAGWVAYQTAQITQAETKATQRQAILDRLGLTSEEARLLLS